MSSPLRGSEHQIPSMVSCHTRPVSVGGRRYQTTCKRGHPLSGENVTIVSGKRRCRTCHNARRRCEVWAYRKSEPGKLLARGPLDYDRPVTVRCAVCAGVFERPLSEIGAACPHCGRYAEAVA